MLSSATSSNLTVFFHPSSVSFSQYPPVVVYSTPKLPVTWSLLFPIILFGDRRASQTSAETEREEYDDSASINSSVTGFPARGTVGFTVRGVFVPEDEAGAGAEGGLGRGRRLREVGLASTHVCSFLCVRQW